MPNYEYRTFLPRFLRMLLDMKIISPLYRLRAFVIACLACGLLLCAAVWVITARKTAPHSEDAFVVVNGAVLTEREADREVELRIATDADRLAPDRLVELRRITRETVTREFVNRQLLLEETERKGIEADSAAVERRWASVRSASVPRLATSDILRVHLIGQDRTRADVVESVRIDALLNELMTEGVEVTAADIAEYSEEHLDTLMSADSVKARHLLVRIPEMANTEVIAAKRELAESIHARLLAGEEFAQTAAEYPGEEVGYAEASHPIKRGEFFVRQVDDVLFSIALEQVSPVIESAFGFHIIKVVSREEGKMPDDAVLRGAVEQQKRSARLHLFMRRLREAATIRYGGAI